MNKSVIKFLVFIFIVGGIAFIVNTYFVQLACVSGDSMMPTLKNDAVVFINKKYNSIEKGDIVVAEKNDVTIIKRVVAVENDNVIIIDGELYVNGEKNDSYENISYSGLAAVEITLKEGEYFVLGNNINHSIDSKYKEIGLLTDSNIIGVVN